LYIYSFAKVSISCFIVLFFSLCLLNVNRSNQYNSKGMNLEAKDSL
jgi:cell division protein FtsX